MGLKAQWCDTCILGAASHAKNACVYLGKGTPKGPRGVGFGGGVWEFDPGKRGNLPHISQNQKPNFKNKKLLNRKLAEQ